jgi:hypothetical protein
MGTRYLRPIKFEEANITFTGPEGIGDLPACRVTDTNGRTIEIVSCWELSDRDLEEINSNRRIWLSVTGPGQPPVALLVDYPFQITDKEFPGLIGADEEDEGDEIPDI